MVDLINSWVKGIIFAVIITVIIEMILPESNNKKYIKTVIGMYIVFVILQPVINKISVNKINLDSIFASYTIPDIETNSIDTNKYIENAYKETIESNIKNSIENMGFYVRDIYVVIDVSEEKYGEIKKVYLEIEDKTSIEKIEQVNININDKNIQKKELSNENIEIIKNFLIQNYGIQQNIIVIGGYDD